jgi:hypothetical protein
MVSSALPSLLFFPYVCHGRNAPDDLLAAWNDARLRVVMPDFDRLSPHV